MTDMIIELNISLNVKRRTFKNLLNKESPDDTFIVQTIPTITEDIQEPNILLEEVQTAIRNLKSGKAPGFDGISAEKLKPTGEVYKSYKHTINV